MAGITGTDADLSDGSPVSPDPELSRSEADAPNATGPAIAEILSQAKEQLAVAGSSQEKLDERLTA